MTAWAEFCSKPLVHTDNIVSMGSRRGSGSARGEGKSLATD
jgi:hypothetical protein